MNGATILEEVKNGEVLTEVLMPINSLPKLTMNKNVKSTSSCHLIHSSVISARASYSSCDNSLLTKAKRLLWTSLVWGNEPIVVVGSNDLKASFWIASRSQTLANECNRHQSNLQPGTSSAFSPTRIVARSSLLARGLHLDRTWMASSRIIHLIFQLQKRSGSRWLVQILH